MNLDKVYKDQAFANAVIPNGTKLVFLGYQNGIDGLITLRYKDSDGFHNLTIAAGSQQSTQSAASSPIEDLGGYFTNDTIQGALQQLGSSLGSIHTALGQITGDTTQTLADIVGE